MFQVIPAHLPCASRSRGDTWPVTELPEGLLSASGEDDEDDEFEDEEDED